ncbi:glycerate kinase [uncultured Propionibacterium sp.]|uniref:glycerate kinase n=1 Tax=uncultured Propionibacterium sp. TaxID=218066 RepID=UPI002930AE7A|nr:glycerate kinase [uncultured Propionibacterium sp.]
MRVLVAAGAMAGFDAWRAGAGIGRAWREAGAEVALVPLAEMGPSWRHARENLAGPDDALFIPLDGHDHDSGPMLLSFLSGSGPSTLAGAAGPARGARRLNTDGARARLAGRPLVGLCRSGEQDAVLTGMYGLAGRRQDLPLPRRLALDRMLASWAELLASGSSDPVAPAGGEALAAMPGSGAGGGAGAVVLALGGRVLAGPEALGEVAGIDRTMAAADLVVTSCEDFDVDAWGGPVVDYVVRRAAAAGRPVVVITRMNRTSLVGQRRSGIEAVHAVGDGDITDGCLAFARSWFW